MTKIYELPNDKTIMADVDEKHHTATVSVYALDDLVEAVNKTAMDEWIPVSERLPEEYGEYLITWTGILGEHGEKRTKPLLSIAEYEIYEPENYEDWITTENEFEHYRDIKVSAWMPLPEPYDPQESEE